MSSSSADRLRKEVKEMNEDPPEGCTAAPVDDNLYLWQASVTGPEDTPYEEGLFFMTLKFPQDYPFSPPKCVFSTRIYHPNISTDGAVCLNVLKKDWSPFLTVSKVLLSIVGLLSEPNPHDPLVESIADQMKTDPEAFHNTAKQWTMHYAM